MLRDNQLRAKIARLLFVLLGFFAGTMVLFSLIGPLLPDWMVVDRNLESGGTTAIYLLYGLAGLGYFLLLPASGVAFLLWLHHAYANLRHFSLVRPRYTVGWAVGMWFVPFVNLVRPYSIMRELWLGYQQAAYGRIIASAAVVGWWWAAVLGQLVVAWVSSWFGSAFHNQPTAQDVPAATLLDASARLFAISLTWYVIGRYAWFEEQIISRQLVNQLGLPAPEASPFFTTEQSNYGQPDGY